MSQVYSCTLADYSAYYSVFETTIRYLGGFLSAYDLSGQKFPILLEKAKEVADKLAFAWVGVSVKDLNRAKFVQMCFQTVKSHPLQ